MEFYQFPDEINTQANRGVTYAKISTNFGPVNVYCTHFQPGYAYNPTDNDPLSPINVAQYIFTINLIKQKAKTFEPSILLGDFNSGPGTGSITPIWPDHYELILKDGFKSAFENPICTFGCNSFSNVNSGGNKQCIDHILTKGRTFSGPVCSSHAKTFLQNCDITVGRVGIPASDHFGISASICPSWLQNQTDIKQK